MNLSELAGAPNSLSLAEDIYTKLRQGIRSGALAPDAKLNIAQIAKQYGVSLSSVRESLSKLVGDGFVVSEVNKGFRVAPVSRSELIDLVATRIEIEGLCLRDSVEHGDIEWQSGIVAAFHRLNETSDFDAEHPERPNADWTEAHDRFHAALVAACRSPIKLRIRAALNDQMERYRRLSVALRKKDRNVRAEHRAFMETALARDADRLVDLMHGHLEATQSILLSSPLLVEPTVGVRAAGGKRLTISVP